MNNEELYRLLEWFEKSGLTEIRVARGDGKVVMKKSLPGTPPAGTPVQEGEAARTEVPDPLAPPEETDPRTELITSPMVGVFYRSPAADAPPFVEPGSRVGRGGPLCILEAMKVMNTLEAEFGCEIVEVLAENGALVEFGTPLFKVRRDDQIPADR